MVLHRSSVFRHPSTDSARIGPNLSSPANGPITTIPPFANTAELPACATFCGPLYDANGACVPPAAPAGQASAYTACFCAHSTLVPFSSVATGICDNACPPEGLTSVQKWFQNICSVDANKDNGNNNNGGNNGGNDNNGNNGGNNNGDSGNGESAPKPVPIESPSGDW